MRDNLKRDEEEVGTPGQQLGLQYSKVEVGQTYPIFGMITNIKEEEEGVVVEINHHVTAKIQVNDSARLETLKQKAFETGIFVSTVLSTEPELEVHCKAVIFGKNQSYNA